MLTNGAEFTEQVYAGTELREIINENLDELSGRFLRTAFVLRESAGLFHRRGAEENSESPRTHSKPACGGATPPRWRETPLGRRLKRMKDGA